MTPGTWLGRAPLVIAAIAVAIGLGMLLVLLRGEAPVAVTAEPSALEREVFARYSNGLAATQPDDPIFSHDDVPAPDEEPASGPERLKWLQARLGTTYAAITLASKQLEFLTALKQPTIEQTEVRDQVRAHLRELEQHAEAQRVVIDGFDVTAPPKSDDNRRTGAPVTVSAALMLPREEWNRLVSQHLAPNTTIAAPAWKALEHELSGARTTLDAIKIPSGLAGDVRAEFLPVVDAVMLREATADRAAAETILAARWQQFISRTRALSAGPPT